jgi:hypothetical protein
MTARPGEVKAVIPIMVARRRDRGSAEFSKIYQVAERLLATEALE